MNEQIIILIFLVLALGATLWLYILKAKKQVEYKGDERWLTIQLKANQSANIANWTLIILLAIATSVPLFIDIQIMFTLDCIFRKNCASVPEERSAIPLQTEQSSAG